MLSKIVGVELAAKARSPFRLPGQETGAAQTIKADGVDGTLAAYDPSHHINERFVSVQRRQQTSQMVRKDSIIQIGLSLQFGNRDSMRHQFAQRFADQKRLAPHQAS